MELVGIEFENYASFPRRYVPVNKGIQILAGKNNSGKTALLRGITILNHIFGRGTPLGDPAQYCPSKNGSRETVLRAHFSLSPEEGRSLEMPDETIDRLLVQHNAVLNYEILWSGGNYFFGQCELLWSDGELPLLIPQRDFLHFSRIRPNQPPSMQTIGTQSRVERNGRYYYLPTISQIQAALNAQNPILFVEAHREVQERVQLQAQASLLPDASNLANFLLTLRNNVEGRYKFGAIEQFVLGVFPEFKALLPQPDPGSQRVDLVFEAQLGSEPLLLTHCGTGVEQLLTLAAFVVTAPRGSIILLDEPHSFLHPDAERQLLAFLRQHPEHRYVIATHSPIFINAVSPDQISYVERAQSTRYGSASHVIIAELMRALGYQNSDFLFHNRLIFLEGDSDQGIIPILLKKVTPSKTLELEATGFPLVHGVPGSGKPGSGQRNIGRIQNSIIKCEKFLSQFGRTTVPCLYLFDGDFSPADRNELIGTKVGAFSRRIFEFA